MLDLVHLTFIGVKVAPASIRFGSRLTLVRGPSDTGKSFVVSALDFMLGARELQYVPQRDGYSDVLLGMRVDGQEWTLMRAVNGGRFFLFSGLHESKPEGAPERSLAPTHSGTSIENLSTWLLDALGLAGARLRKNVYNATVALSFRDLAHLVVIDETKMQSPVPPPVTGSYVSRTKELSALRLLLENDDDGNLPEVESAPDVRRLKGAKFEVIDQLIGRVLEQLSGSAEADELRDQRARINSALDGGVALVRQLTAERTSLSETLRRDQVRLRALELRISQQAGLVARFKLLGEQYRSDLSRLEAVVEGGTLLGYFDPGVCPLCGAEPAHQHREVSDESEGLTDSAIAERESTQALLEDLADTLVGLEESLMATRAARSVTRERISEQGRSLQSIEDRLKPERGDTKELLSKRSEVESILAKHMQLAELQRVRIEIENETAAESRAQASAIGVSALNELSRELVERLDAWGYPFTADARYDRAQNDIYSDDQFRADHGKGVRSILHAAFTVSLAQYCLARGLPHPGFVVLDSPVVTYRAPDSSDPIAGDLSFATRLYADLQANFLGQAIVMENTDPDEVLESDFVDIVFSKQSGIGRYGFFPYLESG